MSIVIVGAGPAGIAAAVTLEDSGARVTLLDDNPCAGGQIWRGGNTKDSPWLDRLTRSNAVVITGARVLSGDAARQTLLVDVNGKKEGVAYSKLILATGAREFFLPFPGWTLPKVMGVGGLQALVKSGLPVAGKRIVVAGSGPLLLAVASYLRKCGAVVPLIAEQAPATSLASFALALAAHPAKVRQSIELNPLLAGIRYLSGCWVESASGSSRLERVRLRRGSQVWEEPCDYLANALGFVANTELALYMGCAVEAGAVKVDQWQQTSLANVYCAGEIAGIGGGVDTAILEGQIAGFAISGQPGQAGKLHRRLRKAKSFAQLLNKTFQPRAELRSLAQPDTVVCRCEDVTLSRLRQADSWRSAKLHERCGMGPCQGRICGPAVQFMLGWEPSSLRPPLSPTRLENLIQENSVK
jgi:NADPH-dependent 2,4-dienoyl-CoA reductase/sulfur reductase-like enzyme